jgi:hypothetical protein
LTAELDDKQKRIESLEHAAVARWPAGTAETHSSWGLSLLAAIGLSAVGLFIAIRRKRAVPAVRAAKSLDPAELAAAGGRMVVDKEMLARAMADIDRVFKLKLDKERSRHQQEMASQATTIAQLERQLREQLEARQRDGGTETSRKRTTKERDKEFHAEVVRLQVAHLAEVQLREEQTARLLEEHAVAMKARDEQLSRMQAEQGAFEKQLSRLRQEVLQQQKKVVSLRTRLTSARQRPESPSLAPSNGQFAGVGGLLAQQVKAQLASISS